LTWSWLRSSPVQKPSALDSVSREILICLTSTTPGCHSTSTSLNSSTSNITTKKSLELKKR
jgi:Na+-transporting NADH:ubiquinone oxidoreductase subunit NqrA